mgnify:CR=1 FL=1
MLLVIYPILISNLEEKDIYSFTLPSFKLTTKYFVERVNQNVRNGHHNSNHSSD